MHKCINNSIGNVYHLEQFVSDFFPYSQEKLGFDKPATIRFESDTDNAGVMLGKTAYYDPEAMEVVLYVDGRHPKDVMRSLSHELVHHAQNCRGDFTGQNNTGLGYAQSDPHLRKMEREAYTKGNLIFRDFEDLIKTGKINIEIDFSDSGEPKMSLKEWKNAELNRNLMKKWGFLKESKEVTTEDTTELEEGHKCGPSCGCPDMEEGMMYRDDDKSEEDESDNMEGDQFGMDDPLKHDKLAEDAGDTEAWNDWKNEHADDDHIKEIEHHLRALKDDRDHERDDAEYDHDHYEDEGMEEAKRHVAGGVPGVADFIMPNKPKGKPPEPGKRIMDPRHLKDKTTKVPPVKVREGKISVKEAKEITRKIIERIKKEGK
jgi:hypothetical protein